MMRWIGLVAFLIAGPAAAADYTIVVQGVPSGSMAVQTAGSRRTIDYETSGSQGFVGRSVVETDGKGLITRLDSKGRSSIAGERFERFETMPTGGRWETSVDKGSSPVPGFYNPVAGNAEQLAILARALLAAPGGQLPLLPSGQASVVKADHVDIGGAAGPVPVDLYLISGLSKRPVPLWLDDSRELVARMAGVEPSTIRKDLAAAGPRLLSLQEARLAEADRALAREAVERPDVPVLIRNARLYDSTAARMRPRTSVLIQGERILAVSPDRRLAAPRNARIIDAGGRALLPGLWDSHVHMFDTSEAVMTLASGVTSVRDMGNDGKLTSQWRRRFDAGDLIGPRLFTAAVLDGPSEGTVPWAHIVRTEQDVDTLVDRLAKEGYGTIKVFNSLPRPLALEAVKRAHQRHLLAGGHLPASMRLGELIAAGLDESTHLDFLAMQFVGPYGPEDVPGPKRLALLAARGDRIVPTSPEVAAMLAAMRRGSVSLDPTVTTLELLMRDPPDRFSSYVAPLVGRLPGGYVRGMVGFAPADPVARARSEAAFRKMLGLLGEAARAGVPIVAGTDGEPGIMVARELELYVEAGMTPLKALQTATINPARRLGVARDLGSVEPGKLADLILVDGNPETRVGDVRNLVFVMKGGAILDVSRISAHVGMKPSAGAARFAAQGRRAHAQDIRP